MRILRFRVWDKKDSWWVSPNVVLDYSGLLFWSFGGEVRLSDDPERYDVQLFTGFLDRNGKEIYAENIFKSRSRVSPFRIVFFNGAFRGLYGKDEPTMDMPGFLFDNYEASDGEVIGNIYEHKHLLEEKCPKE